MMPKRYFLLLLMFAAAAICRAEGTPEDALREAQELERAGNVQKAAGVYEAFLTKYPDHAQIVEVHYRLSKAYDALGLVDKTVAQLKAVTESDKKQFKNRPDAFYTLGKLYASDKKYDLATGAFEKMLSEGAGLYEEEVLNLCGGYYAMQQKYQEAAAKFNILKRKPDSTLAEGAASKLTLLWLKAEKMDLAVDALQDVVARFPKSKQIPELLLRTADAYRTQKNYEKTISLCEQLRTGYPQEPEALAASYILGLVYRDKKDFQKAADALDAVGRNKDFQNRGVAAESLLQSADVYFSQLNDAAKAMERYDEAAKIARDSDSDRKADILQQCYFRLGEYNYTQKKWSLALEYYSLLRALNPKINVLGRILSCEAQLGEADAVPSVSDADVKTLDEKIKANPGTSIAAEAEVFLADRKLTEATKKQAGYGAIADTYEKIIAKYPKDVLTKERLDAYIYLQIGICRAAGAAVEDWKKAVAAFQKVKEIDSTEANPYRIPALENLAQVAERAGDKPLSISAYNELFALSKKNLDAHKDDKAVEKKTLEYMKSLVTRSDTAAMMDNSIELTKKMIEERGPLSDLSRESRFYLGELYYLKKDYSSAAKTFKEFIQIYGPKQNGEGDIAEGPWRPNAADEKTGQVYEAAVRVAHAWYMQGHDQNMVKAYQWIVKNFPNNNKYVAEAQYWLALELGKGEAGKGKEAQRSLAEAMWRNVVCPSLEFTDGKPNKSKYYFWVGGTDLDKNGDVQKYVKAAILKAGQTFSEIGEHEIAAGCFKSYLEIYPAPRGDGKRGKTMTPGDDMFDIAHYALGREYIALNNVTKLIDTYKTFITGLRDDRFRVSGLKLLGYYAGAAGQTEQGVEAYATLLDEYGENELKPTGEPIPVAAANRLRAGSTGWDGIRMPLPKDLDLGEIRYSVGYFYFKGEDWARCTKALQPFISDVSLASSKSRAKALFMAGQSFYKLRDYPNGLKAIATLIKEHPHFEAAEEAYVYAAQGYFEAKSWKDLDLTCRNFIAEWPKSDRRYRIDLYVALSQIGQGKSAAGMSALKTLAASDAYDDVKADAYYQLALNTPKAEEAFVFLEKSMVLPREAACLEAGKCAIKLKKWDKAKEYLDKATREFPKADPKVVGEARELLPQVQKELVKQPK